MLFFCYDFFGFILPIHQLLQLLLIAVIAHEYMSFSHIAIKASQLSAQQWVFYPALQREANLASVVQTLGSAIHWINHQGYCGETYCTIHWIEIYPVDSAIQPLNNPGLLIKNMPAEMYPVSNSLWQLNSGFTLLFLCYPPPPTFCFFLLITKAIEK